MALTRPTQISTDPAVNASALAALNAAFDQIEMQDWEPIGPRIAFQNSWANKAGFSPAAIRKNALGQVELRGVITSPAGAGTGNATVAFTLPLGYAPKTNRQLPQVGFSAATGTVQVGSATVHTDGTVTMTLSTAAANAVVDNITLEGIFSVI